MRYFLRRTLPHPAVALGVVLWGLRELIALQQARRTTRRRLK